MLIRVDTARRAREVLEVDDLKRFSVVVAGAPGGDIPGSLGLLARPAADGAHVWVSIERLRVECARDGDSEWQAGFDRMVAFAAERGWLDPTGAELRAHIQTADDGAGADSA